MWTILFDDRWVGGSMADILYDVYRIVKGA